MPVGHGQPDSAHGYGTWHMAPITGAQRVPYGRPPGDQPRLDGTISGSTTTEGT